MFTANALPVLRFKTIGENNIHDGDVIQLYRIEWIWHYINLIINLFNLFNYLIYIL